MVRFEVVRTFPALPGEVWQVYTDHAGWSEWTVFSRSWLERESGTEDRNGTGAVRGLSYRGLPAVFEEILDFEPPRRMAYRMVKGPIPVRNYRAEVLFVQVDSSTQVTWRCRFESQIPGLGGLLRWFFRRTFVSVLDGLARHHFPGPEKSNDMKAS